MAFLLFLPLLLIPVLVCHSLAEQEKLANMTDEEREKYLENLKKEQQDRLERRTEQTMDDLAVGASDTIAAQLHQLSCQDEDCPYHF